MDTLRIGIVGLGRLGRVHAENIACKIPGAQLVAACTTRPETVAFARQLGVTALYTDFNQMLSEADMDAVAIISTSSEHCWQIAAALDAGKHVFSEKPLGVNLDQCLQAQAAVERHPELTFMLGFMRRYDPSYAYAKRQVEAGVIGTPYLVKATGLDPEAVVEDAIRFCKNSGGIFPVSYTHLTLPTTERV